MAARRSGPEDAFSVRARYVLLALAFGPVFYVVLAFATRLFPWTKSLPELDLLLGPPWQVATSFSLASGVVAWLLRGWFLRTRGTNTLLCAFTALVLGGALFMCFRLWVGSWWEFREVHDEKGLVAAIGFLLLSSFSGAFLGGLFSLFYLPVALPLVWLGILGLRALWRMPAGAGA